MNTFLRLSAISRATIFCAVFFVSFYSCTKDEGKKDFDVNNSLTLFKIDNNNNNQDLSSTDTVTSASGVNGKYILVSGATGAAAGLDSIRLELFTMGDSLLNAVTINSFFKPEYHVLNTQLNIPASERGKVYKVKVTVVDKTGAVVGTKTFYGVDVVTCDPLPPCIVNDQITVIVETPSGTPENEDISLFGSLNGWNRSDQTFKLHKNPDVPNCYCVSVPFAPGLNSWQLNEIFVVRGAAWEKQAVNLDNSDFIVKYENSEMGPIWKIKVLKWRDK